MTANSSANQGIPPSSSANHWSEEEDDDALLSTLFLPPTDNDNDNDEDASQLDYSGELNIKLASLQKRLGQDVHRALNDGWWDNIVRGTETEMGEGMSDYYGGGASSYRWKQNSEREEDPSSTNIIPFPKAFTTAGGKAHVTAIMDLLGLTQTRAVQLTLATLRSFASLSSSSSSSSSSANDDDDDNEEQEGEKLRSLLGTRELFSRVLNHHKTQFINRLLIITECLRLEQEYSNTAANASNDREVGSNDESEGRTKKMHRLGQSCTNFLNTIDSSTTTSNDNKRRGLFQLLLRLACGPALPGLGNTVDYPSSVNNLSRGGGGGGEYYTKVHNNNNGDDEYYSNIVRVVSSEALSILLYDRLDGGASRYDLLLVMNAATTCTSFEFGKKKKASIRTTSRKGQSFRSSSSMLMSQHSLGMVDIGGGGDETKTRLDGLWALICAGCVGLWRTGGSTNANNESEDEWVTTHPLLAGLIVGTSASQAVARNELRVLCRKLHSLGETVRDRREAAYALVSSSSDEVNDDDDELWGIHAPEAIALLSLTLLLRLAGLARGSSDNDDDDNNTFFTEMNSWGEECAQFANDECGAFAYLHQVMRALVQDPLTGSSIRRRNIGNNALVSDLMKRDEFEMAFHDRLLTLTDNRDDIDADEGWVGATDATSVVYASIGREILSATIRAFRTVLLSLQSHTSAIENIGMLSDLASMIHSNSRVLCEQFWSDWEAFCQREDSDDMVNGGDGGEPICYLLDASHSMAVLTLIDMKTKTQGSQSAIHYLKPLSTFLRLISSLCASPSMVRSILTSDFLPEGIVESVMSVIAALAPLISSLNLSSSPISAEERSTVRCATTAIQSISALAYLGGAKAKDWIRNSLRGGPRMIYQIASKVLPHKQNGLENECTALTSSVLNLMVDLLEGSDVLYQMEVLDCFTPSNSNGFGVGNSISGFSHFVTSSDDGITLAALTILNCLASKLMQNMFDPRVIPFGKVNIETVGAGVMIALDVLSGFFSGGQVTFPTSKVQLAFVHAILSSVTTTLICLKQVIYLHEDTELRGLALTLRNDIISTLSSSTALGQVIAFFASAPVSLMITKTVSAKSDLSLAMDSAAVRYEDNKHDSKYGSWGKFVTPKRASQIASASRAQEKSAEHSNDLLGNEKEIVGSEWSDLGLMALSLILVWGQHSEDIAKNLPDQDLLHYSPCNLLLSKACPNSLQSHAAAVNLNIVNLKLISRLAVIGVDGLGVESALLASKIFKMCLQHANKGAHDMGFIDFRRTLGCGNQLFLVLLSIFDKFDGDDTSCIYLQRMDQQVLMASIVFECVAISVSTQPDFARSILLGDKNTEDWRLLDKIVSFILSTSKMLNDSRDYEGSVGEEKLLNLRSLFTCACLQAVSALWKCCRLTCNQDYSSGSVHACGSVATYLLNSNKTGTTSVVPNIVDLTRVALLAVMSLGEKSSMQNEVSAALVNQKSILLDLLTRSLDIITIEINVRTGQGSEGGIKFVEDLFDSDPMECWKVILTSSDAVALAATTWLQCSPTWNIASFLRANPPEDDVSTTSWCSYGSVVSLAKALALSGDVSANTFVQCRALNALTRSETSFSASWSIFTEVIIANMNETSSTKSTSGVIVECAIAALSSISESKMIAESLLLSQGYLREIGDAQPLGELCSLVLYSITAGNAELNTLNCLDILARLYESTNKIFAMTQLGSVAPSNEPAICSMRSQLLTSALVLILEFVSLSQDEVTSDAIMKYNYIRIGFTDIAVKSLQSLQYVQLDDNVNEIVEHGFVPSKFGFSFDGTKSASYQMLRSSLLLLISLVPSTLGSNTKLGDYQLLTYGVDFASCLKERSAINSLLYHLGVASNISSLTYQVVYAGKSTHEVEIIHNNAVDVVQLITSCIHALTDSGSMVVDILLLLLENRCFRSLIDNPLWKMSGKTWTSTSDDYMIPVVDRHRGYYTSHSRQGTTNTSSSRKPHKSCQIDSVHATWREVIQIFSSLIRSARYQVVIHANIDEHVMCQLNDVPTAVLDFICAYEDELLSCFSSMSSEARTQVNLAGGKAKSSTFASIQSSSFAFTLNLLKESADISSLFAELCRGETKILFANKCSSIFKSVLSTSLELAKLTSSFLGSVGNARELFLALSNASAKLDSMAHFDHPMLAEGIPNARHEAIRNAHFAHSCCIILTDQDVSDSHVATTKAAESTAGKDSSLEKSFQIFVNNKLIAELEQVAGHCLLNALCVLSDAHPALDSFVHFSIEEASRLDVASVILPGITVAICPQQQFQRYSTQQETIQYASTLACDRPTRTISVEYFESGLVDQHVPWSSIVGMEDASKKQFIFSYGPAPKSIGETDNQGPPSLGHLIMTLKWCRHISSMINSEKSSTYSLHLIRCVVERAAQLLCTEVLLHDELREKELRDDDTSQRLNMQLLDLFPLADSNQSNSLALVMGEKRLDSVRTSLKRHLTEAARLREEERKLWQQNNTGWDSTSFWGSGTKRQGRRSPFRLSGNVIQ